MRSNTINSCPNAFVVKAIRISIHLRLILLEVMKRLILLFFMAIFVFNAVAQQEIQVQNGEIQLNGTLLKPKKAKTLVIIIAGSGPTDRNGNNPGIPGENNSLKYLAEGLEGKGVACFRFDKRTLNPNFTIPEEKIRFDDFVMDAKTIYHYFRNQGIYDKIGFAGHSEGSLIGAIAAKEVNADFMISISGVGTSMVEMIKTQLAAQPSTQFPPEMKATAFADLDSLAAGMLVKNPPKGLESIFRPSVQPYLISWLKYDPAQVYGSLTCPILILQGDNDIQVATAEALALQSSNSRAQIYVIKGMNHVLKISSTDRVQNLASYSNPKLPVPKELTGTMVRFLDGL